MSSPRPRFLWREILLLCAPLLFLAGATFYALRKPKVAPPKPKKWEVVTKWQPRAPFPYEVRKGIDTTFSLQTSLVLTQGNFPNVRGRSWQDVRLIAVAPDGKITRLWDAKNNHLLPFAPENYKLSQKMVFGGSGGGNSENWHMSYAFALRRFPLPTHRLELRVDSVWRPVPPGKSSVEATPGEVERMRAQPDAISESRRFVLREMGQKTRVPVVSKDPLFDVRRVELVEAKSYDGPALEVRWHVRWRGAKIQDVSNGSGFPLASSLYFADEKNNVFGTNWTTMRCDWNFEKPSRDFAVWDSMNLSWNRKTARELNSKKLFLRGWISVGGAWPRAVNIALPSWVLHPPKTKSKPRK